MSARKEWHPEKVRSGLTHPVIDADGHWIEYGPVFAERVRKAAGDKAKIGKMPYLHQHPQWMLDVPAGGFLYGSCAEATTDGVTAMRRISSVRMERPLERVRYRLLPSLTVP